MSYTCSWCGKTVYSNVHGANYGSDVFCGKKCKNEYLAKRYPEKPKSSSKSDDSDSGGGGGGDIDFSGLGGIIGFVVIGLIGLILWAGKDDIIAWAGTNIWAIILFFVFSGASVFGLYVINENVDKGLLMKIFGFPLVITIGGVAAYYVSKGMWWWLLLHALISGGSIFGLCKLSEKSGDGFKGGALVFFGLPLLLFILLGVFSIHLPRPTIE